MFDDNGIACRFECASVHKVGCPAGQTTERRACKLGLREFFENLIFDFIHFDGVVQGERDSFRTFVSDPSRGQ